MWKNVAAILEELGAQIPISKVSLLGSFTTKKKRPNDVDFILMLRTPVRARREKWSIDMVVVPDNAHGDLVAEDAKKWTRHKYGATRCLITDFEIASPRRKKSRRA